MRYKDKGSSGGWRMRVSLQKKLFFIAFPTLLIWMSLLIIWILCGWRKGLSKYDRISLGHSQFSGFLEFVCTNIIDLNHKKELVYYSGNYDTYIKTSKNLKSIKPKHMKANKKKLLI
jgi:ATP-binding cassette subfamily F protein 2